MNRRADLVVVGGGPAGAAAAIWARTRGLDVVLFERTAFPRYRPGETLHPGIQPVLERLGVAQRVTAASPLRPHGHIVAWGGPAVFAPFGNDTRGPWRAFQIARAEFDAILLARAAEIGVSVIQPAPAIVPRRGRSGLVGVQAGALQIDSPFMIDASGAAGWLRRALKLGEEVRSPRLIASFGYVKNQGDVTPRLAGDARGWIWTAPVRHDCLHWTRIAFRNSQLRPALPSALAERAAIGPVRGADVTWRRVHALSGPGYFLAGEAAGVVDPASGHGVLRALMSGMMAAHNVAAVLNGELTASDAARHYRQWINEWFERDTARLSQMYGQLNPTWADVATATAR